MSTGQVHPDDKHDDLVDKLRHDDFKGLVKSANDAHGQQLEQQLCLGSDGSVSRADPYSAYAHISGQRHGAAAASGGLPEHQQPSEDDELRRLREQRLAQMKTEHSWREQGHGRLRELVSDKDFVQVVRPHERAVVLLTDSITDRTVEDVTEALQELAKKHVEAQFCHLELQNAGIMSIMLNLDEGVPVVFVLKHGEVKASLPPRRLFEFASASSPLFSRHLASLLRRVGGIGSGIEDANSDSGCDSEEEERRRIRRR